MKESSELILERLENFEDVFQLWKEKILLGQNSPSKEKAEENGLIMIGIIKRAINNTITEDEILSLAYKIAKERLDADVNIGELVYNMNLGRRILLRHINQSELGAETLQDIVDRINLQFDKFLYHAVTKYTELKNEQLYEKALIINQSHNDKLTLLGQMSSSFVHEFRNPLTSVMGFIKLLKSEYPDLKYMDTIENELDQLKFRITQFLHASKLDIVEKRKEIVSLRTLFDEMIKFLYPSIVDGDVVITTQIDDISIQIFKDEIKQVFLNLILNSIDALQLKNSQREIMIECIQKEGFVQLTIANNGPAIKPENKEIIFEPFYTTKELGTGIGLFVCKKIIEKHSGTIICDSDDNLTSFKILLPLLPVEPF